MEDKINKVLFVVLILCMVMLPGCRDHNNEIITDNHVLLFHGLAMSSMIMYPLELYLEDLGYTVYNIGYPSTSETIEEIVNGHVQPWIKKVYRETGNPVHIVTHSMGGIIVRYYLGKNGNEHVKSMVMIAPPNRGSMMASILKEYSLARWFFGPALKQLSVDGENIIDELQPLQVPTGIIAGCYSINPVNSFLIPGDDDGTVAVSHTIAPGMLDHVVVPKSHSGILFDQRVHRMVASFLASGEF